jgi:hypothetical protein
MTGHLLLVTTFFRALAGNDSSTEFRISTATTPRPRGATEAAVSREFLARRAAYIATGHFVLAVRLGSCGEAKIV